MSELVEAETTVAKQKVLNKMTSSFNGRTPGKFPLGNGK